MKYIEYVERSDCVANVREQGCRLGRWMSDQYNFKLHIKGKSPTCQNLYQLLAQTEDIPGVIILNLEVVLQGQT